MSCIKKQVRNGLKITGEAVCKSAANLRAFAGGLPELDFRRFINKGLKRTGALLTAVLLLINSLPLGYFTARAFDPDLFRVDSVRVYKVYNSDKNLELRRILITGSYLKGAEVGIITSTGLERLTNRTVDSEGTLQFDIAKDQLGSRVLIEGISIPIDENEMPTLTGVNRKVELGTDDLILQGTNLSNVNDAPDRIKAGYEHEGAYTPIEDSLFVNNTTVTIPTPSGQLGYQNIIFEKDTEVSVDFGNSNGIRDVSVTVIYNYRDQFRFVEKLSVPGLTMHPNRGEKGDRVYFEAPTPNLDNYDVFFVKTLEEAYTNQNKGRNKSFQQNVSGKDILSVEVPDLPVGEYYVVLTNPVSGSNPMEEVVRELVVMTGSQYEKFSIIDGNIKSKIISVQPNSGPDTGSKTTITGQFFITMNIPEYAPSPGGEMYIEDPDTDTDNKTLIAFYPEGSYNNVAVSSVQRRIRVYVGGEAIFLTNADNQYDVIYSSDLDRIVVRTPQVTDAEINPRKDVVVETETVFTRADGTGTFTITERAELSLGYTYIPSKIAPEITSVVPDKLQVSGSGPYSVPEDVVIAIHGRNFMIHKLQNSDGSTETRYPIIEFGTDIGLNKNSNQNTGDPPSDPSLSIRVFDASGNELDGAEGSEVGTKILVTLPAGKTVNELGKTFVRVTNPMRNSTNSGLSAIKVDGVEFVNPDENKNPVITDVTPDVVTVDGGERITVTGSNFAVGVRVFLDGEEVRSITRREDGRQITFICPRGREGETQLQVMNPEGGIAIWTFTFVTAYTNPRITDFSPKSGNTGTLVIITGDNFLKPDPTATEDSILRLIGTRVLLEGIEVNEYNIDSATKKIILIDYAAPDADKYLLRVENGRLAVADYYSALILQNTDSAGRKRFYTITADSKGQYILSDGAGNNYTLQYNSASGEIEASREGGGNLPVYVGAGAITLGSGADAIELAFKTPFKVTNGIITGNRVRVVDINHIYFTVPILEADGYYDVTVINPDTKRDSRMDERGFYYYGMPQSRPFITEIRPDQGSTEGGYTIEIRGGGFEDNGTSKSRVYINGVEVRADDTWVNIDGTVVTVKVPAFSGDLLGDYGTSRLEVPVVVVNPDGGSASEEFGFTYVVPSSHPQITKLVPQKGTAAGGDIVEITGTDFRYYEPYDDKNRNQIKDEDEDFNDLNGDGVWNSEADAEDWLNKVELPNNSQYDYYYDNKILPEIYFGSRRARIVEFSRGYIKVVTPPGNAGRVDVYLVNNDSGKSNTVSFEYVSSAPRITSVLPAEGKRKGGDLVEIMGAGFLQSSLEIYREALDDSGNNLTHTVSMPLVRFGGISNRSIPRELENSGRIDNGRTTVNLAGGLTISYNSDEKRLSLTIADQGTYSADIYGYSGTEGNVKYIPVSLLRSSEGAAYGGLELIRVEIEDRRLLVDRGYAPEATLVSSGQLSVWTPSYYTVDRVTVTVENPDGGKATGQFEYKNPASSPSIINITREGRQPTEETVDGREVRLVRMSYKGGSMVSIIGEDFREGAVVYISDLLQIRPADISYNLPGRLTFEMPAVPEDAVGRLCKVVVLNEDGGSAASDTLNPPIYILFTKGETSPAIEKVSPSMGSSDGGTKVKIEGRDFRETMEGYSGRISVYFGETRVPDGDVTVVDYKTINVVAPAGAPGKIKVRVENPDGEISDPAGEYTYLSSPRIIAVVDPEDPDEAARISVISIEGGQVIKLKGSGFMDGAAVIFDPVLAEVDDAGSISGRLVYIGGQAYILQSGTPGTRVEVIDSETLTVTTPQGKMDAKGVLVVNEDNGASEIYTDLTYGLPQLGAPQDVTAELVYDRYIKINWRGVGGTREYEIYVVVDDNQIEPIGSTTLNSFIYSELTPRTRYRFIVKAVGDYGSSQPSAESNTVRTGNRVGPPDEDGGLGERTTIVKAGDTANVTIGTDDYNREATSIDLTAGYLAGCKNVVVSLPAAVVTGQGARDITIVGRDFRISFNPSAFNISSMSANNGREDAGVRFTVSPHTSGNSLISGEGTPLSAQYIMGASAFVGKDSTEINYFKSGIKISMDYNETLASQRRLSEVSLNIFDGESGKWAAIGGAYRGDSLVTATSERSGRYMVIGRRN